MDIYIYAAVNNTIKNYYFVRNNKIMILYIVIVAAEYHINIYKILYINELY